MKSLLIVVKEEFLSKGITLALLDYFQSIHSSKNPYEAIKLLKSEKVDVLVSEIDFNTLEANEYIEEIIRNSKTLHSIILLADAPLSVSDLGTVENLIILPKPVSVKNIINSINSLEKKLNKNKNGE